MNKNKSYSIDQIKIGMSESISKIITDKSVRAFSDLSGDKNPVHLDDDYAEKSRYKKRIAHGLLSSSLFSALFGTKIPGEGCVYVSQSLSFKRPVYVGDTVLATVTVKDIDFVSKKVFFDTVCTVNSKVVIDGYAEIFIP